MYLRVRALSVLCRFLGHFVASHAYHVVIYLGCQVYKPGLDERLLRSADGVLGTEDVVHIDRLILKFEKVPANCALGMVEQAKQERSAL
jgi:hypothetical protein